jgi:hypothetical protein
MFWVKDEQTCLHICAKRICDRPRRFVIIERTACRSYMVNKTVDTFLVLNKVLYYILTQQQQTKSLRFPKVNSTYPQII